MYYVCQEYLTYTEPAISSGVIALFVFLILAPWWPSQEPYQTEIWSEFI
jgi:hypothetical protein